MIPVQFRCLGEYRQLGTDWTRPKDSPQRTPRLQEDAEADEALFSCFPWRPLRTSASSAVKLLPFAVAVLVRLVLTRPVRGRFVQPCETLPSGPRAPSRSPSAS